MDVLEYFKAVLIHSLARRTLILNTFLWSPTNPPTQKSQLSLVQSETHTIDPSKIRLLVINDNYFLSLFFEVDMLNFAFFCGWWEWFIAPIRSPFYAALDVQEKVISNSPKFTGNRQISFIWSVILGRGVLTYQSVSR